MNAAPSRPAAVIKRNNVAVAINQLATGQYCFTYVAGGRRKFHRFRDLARARSKALDVAIAISNGKIDQSEFTASDRELLHHAQKTVAPFGVTITAALAEWIDFRRAAHHGKSLSAADTLSRYLLFQREKRNDTRVTADQQRDLAKFLAQMPESLLAIRAETIEEYLASLGVGIRRRNNVRDNITALFRFARSRGFLPDRITEAEKVPRIKIGPHRPSTYTPGELVLFLNAVREQWLPMITLGAFAGLRPSEIHDRKKSRAGHERQLMWEDFHWARRVIDLDAIISKVRKPRKIPISDQLHEWLRPWHEARGPVVPGATLIRSNPAAARERKRLKAVTGLAWKQDALRHSFASYWLAMHHDVHRLARAMGNSPQEIAASYDDPKYEDDAKVWLNIMPEKPGNIIQPDLSLSFK